MIPILKKYFEAFFWIAALLSLAFMNISGNHFSFCPFRFITGSFCPGCGLGHAIHFAFQGNFIASFHAHPMGIPAIAILLYRIIVIFKQKSLLKTNSHAF